MRSEENTIHFFFWIMASLGKCEQIVWCICSGRFVKCNVQEKNISAKKVIWSGKHLRKDARLIIANVVDLKRTGNNERQIPVIFEAYYSNVCKVSFPFWWPKWLQHMFIVSSLSGVFMSQMHASISVCHWFKLAHRIAAVVLRVTTQWLRFPTSH